MRMTARAAALPEFRRRDSAAIDPMIASSHSIPVPTWGWDALSPLANMKPDHAIQLDNIIPRTGYVEMRRGSFAWTGTLYSNSTPVESLIVYNAALGAQLFAACGPNIYDVSSGTASPVVTGMNSARYQYVNFTNTASGHYMVVANGVDIPKLYDGANWSNLNIIGPVLADIIQVNAHHGRLWLVPKNSTQAWYMQVGNISGTATSFDIGDLMTRGGQIMAMATWTVDTQATVNDYAVFITSNGTVAQAIVYAGTDPANASTWQLYGVYEIGPPIGRRCFVNVGGDLGILCIDGLIPMSKLLLTDRTSVENVSITDRILNEFLTSARNYKNHFGWEVVKYPLGMLAILNVPVTENYAAIQYVMNTLTGAWCRFTGLNANCWAVFNDIPYFGGNDGVVRRWDSGPSDSGVAITGTMRTAFNYFGDRNHRKRYTMMRPLMTTNGEAVTPGYCVNTDFSNLATVTTPIAVTV